MYDFIDFFFHCFQSSGSARDTDKKKSRNMFTTTINIVIIYWEYFLRALKTNSCTIKTNIEKQL